MSSTPVQQVAQTQSRCVRIVFEAAVVELCSCQLNCLIGPPPSPRPTSTAALIFYVGKYICVCVWLWWIRLCFIPPEHCTQMWQAKIISFFLFYLPEPYGYQPTLWYTSSNQIRKLECHFHQISFDQISRSGIVRKSNWPWPDQLSGNLHTCPTIMSRPTDLSNQPRSICQNRLEIFVKAGPVWRNEERTKMKRD